MNKKYRFNSHVRYRKEKDHILICDCSTLNDYRLPLEKLQILNMIKDGIYTESNVNEKNLINDLINTGIISEEEL